MARPVQLTARSAASQGATAYLQCLIDERDILDQEAQISERKKKLAASLTREQISRAEQQIRVMPTPKLVSVEPPKKPEPRSGSPG